MLTICEEQKAGGAKRGKRKPAYTPKKKEHKASIKEPIRVL
jgi:hypothetical protein